MKRQIVADELLGLLVCTVCKGDLILQSNDKESYHFLYCGQCDQEYPIDNGIPNMLPPELLVPPDEHRKDISLSVKRANMGYGYCHYCKEYDRDKSLKHPAIVHELPRLVDFTLKYIDRPNMKVLDACSGIGMLSSHLYNRGLKPVCFDISHDSIVALVKYNTNLSNSFVADAENMPLQDNSFDCVLFCTALHHLPNPHKALSESFRVLKDEGRVILLEPNSRNTGIAAEVIRAILRVVLRPSRIKKDFALIYYRVLAKILKRNVIKYGNKEYIRDGNWRWVAFDETDQELSIPYVLQLAKMTGFKVLDVRTQEIAIALAKFIKKDISPETWGKLQRIDQMLLERIPLLNKFGDRMLVALQKNAKQLASKNVGKRR